MVIISQNYDRLSRNNRHDNLHMLEMGTTSSQMDFGGVGPETDFSAAVFLRDRPIKSDPGGVGYLFVLGGGPMGGLGFSFGGDARNEFLAMTPCRRQKFHSGSAGDQVPSSYLSQLSGFGRGYSSIGSSTRL